MKKWIVKSSDCVSGSIKVSGSKNSLLAIIAACLITKSIITLTNVEPFSDTYDMIGILKELNVRILYDHKSKMIIDARYIKNVSLKSEFVKRIRASYYFMGALLSLYKNVEVGVPGGCNFALRPIDLHLYAFSCLGFKCSEGDGGYKFIKEKERNKEIVFSKVSVGATVNAILASCRVRGKVKLINVALEPEIDDLINFLNECGGCIKREGNSIVIEGKSKYHGCCYRVMDDRIEAGTYLILGALKGKKLKVIYKDSMYLKSLIDLLKELNVEVQVCENYISVSAAKNIEDREVVFDIYPGIATDLQQPLSILFSKCLSKSILKDNVYPSRYTQVDDLNSMGFSMQVKDGYLIVNKSEKYEGKEVFCKDLRGGISLILAACLSSGETVINNVHYIERGYSNLIRKLEKIGVRIHEEN